MQCQYCKADNEGGWFYCRKCGRRASTPQFTTNMWRRTELGSRTDIEIDAITIDESVEIMQKQAMEKHYG